jgi:hypothetical protein
MRLGDLDALKAEFERLGLGEHSLIERLFADGVYAVIENAPTIDAVPVCRCKDCKRMNDVQFCVAWEGFVREDDFCSYGERKDGEG